MTTRQASELLYDSEAALRLVDSAIEDLRDVHHDRTLAAASAAELRELLASTGSLDPAGVPELLSRTYAEVVTALGTLREGRLLLESPRQQRHDGPLGDATAALVEMETRLAEIAAVLDPAARRQRTR